MFSLFLNGSNSRATKASDCVFGNWSSIINNALLFLVRHAIERLRDELK